MKLRSRATRRAGGIISAEWETILHLKPEDVEHRRVPHLFKFRYLGIDAQHGRTGPDAIATYCLPLTSKVIGGAVKPDPTLSFQTSSSVVSSNAATVPSNSARNMRPPPVERRPE